MKLYKIFCVGSPRAHNDLRCPHVQWRACLILPIIDQSGKLVTMGHIKGERPEKSAGTADRHSKALACEKLIEQAAKGPDITGGSSPSQLPPVKAVCPCLSSICSFEHLRRLCVQSSTVPACDHYLKSIAMPLRCTCTHGLND